MALHPESHDNPKRFPPRIRRPLRPRRPSRPSRPRAPGVSLPVLPSVSIPSADLIAPSEPSVASPGQTIDRVAGRLAQARGRIDAGQERLSNRFGEARGQVTAAQESIRRRASAFRRRLS